jgi:excisionase family DNA binding protein
MKACEMVGVSRRTIYNWIAANKVEYLRTAGGSIRIFVDTLVARSGWHESIHRTILRPSDSVMVDSKELLHKLNNQLGVILAHAELLETKAQDASQKARASQVVNAALQAMAVSRELRETVGEK